MKKRRLDRQQITVIVICGLFSLLFLAGLAVMIADGGPFLPSGVTALVLTALLVGVIFFTVRDRMLPETIDAMYGRLLGDAFSQNKQRRHLRRLHDAVRLYAEEKNALSLQRLLELEPYCVRDDDFAAVYAFMALNCSRMNDHKQAVSFYRNSLAYRPDQCRLLSNLSSSLTRLKRYDEAIEYGLQAISLNDMDPFALSNTAYALMCVGRDEEAIELAERSLEHHELQAQPIRVLTLAYFHMGNMEKSKEYYTLGRSKGLPAAYLDPFS